MRKPKNSISSYTSPVATLMVVGRYCCNAMKLLNICRTLQTLVGHLKIALFDSKIALKQICYVTLS